MYKKQIDKVFKCPPMLETERLLLRRISVSDAEDMYEYSSREDVTKYLSWEKHCGINFTKKYVKVLSKAYSEGRFFDWGIELKGTGKMIGTCGFTSFDFDKNSCEVGYVINPSFRNRSYATEAVNRIIEFAFDVLGASEVDAKCMDGNEASLAVMKKCGLGFACEYDEFIKKYRRNVKIIICRLTRNEFYTRKQSSEVNI